jgi:hypothetical protein
MQVDIIQALVRRRIARHPELRCSDRRPSADWPAGSCQRCRVHRSGDRTGVDPSHWGRLDDRPGPFYCHLLDMCDHELCTDYDDCMGEACPAWYSIELEGQA